MKTLENKFVAAVRLYQDGGCSGPHAMIDTTVETAVADAIAWAESQSGHPWDGILVNVYRECEIGFGDSIDTHQIECRDGAWECI